MRKLEDIEVDEISLTATPATRKKFYIVKSDEPDNELFSLIMDAMEGDYDIEKAKDSLDKLSDENKKKFLAAIETLKSLSSDLPDDLKGAIKDLMELAQDGYGVEDYGYGYPPKKKKDLIKSALKTKWPSLCTGFSKSELLSMIDDEDVKAEIELEEEIRAEKVRKTAMDVDDPRHEIIEHKAPVDRSADPVAYAIQKYEERVEKTGKVLWPSLCGRD
jgi:hypothetical protein